MLTALGRSGEGKTDCFEGSDGTAACGFDDGADVGVELGLPLGAESIGDLAEHGEGRNARSEPLFVDGMSRLITKTKRYCRVLMIMRLSLTPASWVGVRRMSSSRPALSRAA